MAASHRLLRTVRGVPARLGILLLAGGVIGGWILRPATVSEPATASYPFDGKHADRLAFGADESEVPVRDARIYDTVAMFALPQVEPRRWSESPTAGTVAEAGIRTAPVARAGGAPRMVVAETPTLRRAGEAAAGTPVRVAKTPAATTDPVRSSGKLAAIAPVTLAGAEPAREPVQVFGWNVPLTQHIPTRRDAERALDVTTTKAAAVGTGTVRVVSRTASAVGDGFSSIGGAIAETVGLR